MWSIVPYVDYSVYAMVLHGINRLLTNYKMTRNEIAFSVQIIGT